MSTIATSDESCCIIEPPEVALKDEALSRAHPRKQIRHPVRIYHRSGQLHLSIRDMTPRGSFIDGSCIATVNPGDELWLVIQHDEVEHVLSATVRWCGQSTIHRRHGYGLEFDPLSQETAAKLFDAMAHEDLFFLPS